MKPSEATPQIDKHAGFASLGQCLIARLRAGVEEV